MREPKHQTSDFGQTFLRCKYSGDLYAAIRCDAMVVETREEKPWSVTRAASLSSRRTLDGLRLPWGIMVGVVGLALWCRYAIARATPLAIESLAGHFKGILSGVPLPTV